MHILYRMTEPADRGPVFSGIRIARPGTGSLIDTGYCTLADLPVELGGLLTFHGVGSKAVRRLDQTRAD